MIDEKISCCFGEGKIPAYLEVFTNCREQGYCLSLLKTKNEDTMVYWVCQSRNSDDIMIVIGTYDQKDNVSNCFNDEAFKSVKYFRNDEMDDAVDYVYHHIRYMYKKELDYPSDIEFYTDYSFGDLKKISNEVESLSYSDYYELATYKNKIDKYKNDLIISNGCFYWRISKLYGADLNIEEIKCNPNFNSEEELMIQMRNALVEFIDEQLEYELFSVQEIRM